jgi:hypothetical protein
MIAQILYTKSASIDNPPVLTFTTQNTNDAIGIGKAISVMDDVRTVVVIVNSAKVAEFVNNLP